MFEIWQYPQQVRMARFTSTKQQSCLCRHSTLISKEHLPFSNQPSHILPQPAFFMSSSASFSSFDLQPQNLMPFSRHYHPLSSTNDHANEHFAIAILYIVSFKSRMNIKSVDIFLSFSCTPHIALTIDLSVLHKIPISLSFRHHTSLPCSIAGLV